MFTAEHDLLVMRPYQIAATERILNRILISEYDPKRLGTPECAADTCGIPQAAARR